jgi:hypothetical protein
VQVYQIFIFERNFAVKLTQLVIISTFWIVKQIEINALARSRNCVTDAAWFLRPTLCEPIGYVWAWLDHLLSICPASNACMASELFG